MTLQEAMNRIPEAKRTKRVPSAAAVREEGVPVLWDALDEESSATVYSTGYVVFCKDRHTTVFRLHDCRDYEYWAEEARYEVPFSVFADQPWQIRIFMEGQDRITHSQSTCYYKRKTTLDDWVYGKPWILWTDCSEIDPLNRLLEQERQREEEKTLYEKLAKLPEKQQQTLFLCIVCGKTQEQAAREMGTTRQAVTKCLGRALHNLRRMYGVTGDVGGMNRFSQKNP